MASHTHLSRRIHFPGERDAWFDLKQLPPSICTNATGGRALAVCSVADRRRALPLGAPRYLSGYARGTASNSVTNRRAKALCRHGGSHAWQNIPRASECARGNELWIWTASTWLFAYESSTRRFANLLTVPVAHHKQILNDYIALLRSRSRMQYFNTANISVG